MQFGREVNMTTNEDYTWTEYVCPTCYKKDESIIIYGDENYCCNGHKINWDKVVEIEVNLNN